MPRFSDLSSLISLAASTVAMTFAGCESTPRAATDPPPTVLSLDRGNYPQVFDLAIAVAADEGLPAELRDRDGGVIETRAKPSGSLIEPWNWARGDPGAAWEGTIAFQRRRARFEFIPSGFRPSSIVDATVLTGVRTPGGVDITGGKNDLSNYEGPIELRVWVFVEQAFTPNLQRSTWTFSQTSFADDPVRRAPTVDGTTRDRSIWTPIERDRAMEEELMKLLRQRLAETSTPPAATAAETGTSASASAG